MGFGNDKGREEGTTSNSGSNASIGGGIFSKDNVYEVAKQYA